MFRKKEPRKPKPEEYPREKCPGCGTANVRPYEPGHAPGCAWSLERNR